MQLSRALSVGIVPKIASETKTTNIAPRVKRATILPKAASGTSFRARSGSYLPYVSVGAAALLLFMIGFHLFMINAYATKGFELKKHQQAVRDLNTKQKSLLVEQSALGSISKVNDVAGIYGLVPVGDEEFLNTPQLTQR